MASKKIVYNPTNSNMVKPNLYPKASEIFKQLFINKATSESLIKALIGIFSSRNE